MDPRTDSTVPRPVGVGPEMDALGRFYQDVTWKGVIHEGGMGPGTPAMTGIGHSTSQVIQDGRWIAVDSEQDQYLEDGTFVLKWQLHHDAATAVTIPAVAAHATRRAAVT